MEIILPETVEAGNLSGMCVTFISRVKRRPAKLNGKLEGEKGERQYNY